MDRFQDIFTPPSSPTPEYNPREDILNQIRSMEDGERCDIRAQQFMNQFQTEPQMQDQGEVGGHPQQRIPVNPVGIHPPQGVPPVNTVNPPLNPANPVNLQIVNEYNSFNLANITPPIAPRWKQPGSHLDEFRKFKWSCLHILMVQGAT